ncbi:MAG TPA: hypothetical protein VGV92_04310 [Gammaproteobacteria bacterium]|nr:hypothetical protein [Gammaproteobacteria bacterium]
MAISITQEQLGNLIVKIHEKADEADVSLGDLNAYIQKYNIEAALFADKKNQEKPEALEFFNCFKGYPKNIDPKLAAYAKKYNTEQRQKTDKLVKADAPHRGVIARMKAGQPVGPHQWLDSDDIFHVLLHVVPKDKHNNFLYPNLLSNVEAAQFSDKSRAGARPLCVATNPTGNHWTLTWMDTEEKVRYKDSLHGSDETKQDIQDRLKRIFPHNEVTAPQFTGEQNNGWMCGYLNGIRESLIVLGIDHPITRATTPEGLRDAVFAVMSEIAGKPYTLADHDEQVQVSTKVLASGVDAKLMENVFNDIFSKQIERGAVKLDGDKITTTDLSEESLKEFVENSMKLMETLGLKDQEFDLNAPANIRPQLKAMLEAKGFKIAEPAKAAEPVNPMTRPGI